MILESRSLRFNNPRVSIYAKLLILGWDPVVKHGNNKLSPLVQPPPPPLSSLPFSLFNTSLNMHGGEGGSGEGRVWGVSTSRLPYLLLPLPAPFRSVPSSLCHFFCKNIRKMLQKFSQFLPVPSTLGIRLLPTLLSPASFLLGSCPPPTPRRRKCELSTS